MILRVTQRALADGSDVEARGVLRLAVAFGNILLAGDHFRSAAALCEDVVHLVKELDGFEQEANTLHYQRARALRMMDRLLESRAAFEQLDHVLLTKEQRQRAELGVALNLEGLNDLDGAADAARRVISINRNSSSALHAKVIFPPCKPGIAQPA